MERDSFRAFLTHLSMTGRLETASEPVSCDLEAAEIARRAVGRCALLFENPSGSAFPLVMNVFCSKSAVLESIGLKQITGAPDCLLEETLPEQFRPQTVGNPRFRYKEFSDLTSLPAIRTWKNDGGFALTLPCVITKGRTQNCGMYRVQILDERRAVIHCYPESGAAEHLRQAEERGEKSIEAAICLGAPPSVILASVIPVKADEFEISAALTGRPLKTAEINGLSVPADSEIVLQGRISLTEKAVEGPFGNYTGGYSVPEAFPVFTLEKAYHAENAICPNTAAGAPVSENGFLADAAFRLLTNSIKRSMPELVSFAFPSFGVFGRMIFIALKEGADIKKTADSFLFSRYANICIFDENTDTEDTAECLRLFAGSRLISCEQNRIFDCRLKDTPYISTDEAVVNKVDENAYGFGEWIKRKPL
ncbi:MAG: UbiD family decarboxylase [Deferribacterales bacterium]